MQVIGVSYLFFIITQPGGIFKVKNVLKIEKNEELNYEFGKQNPTSTKLLDFLYVPCGTSSCLPGRGMAGSVSPEEKHYIYKEKFIKR